MAPAVVALAVVVAVVGHNRSEGKSSFVVDLDRDRVDIAVQIVTLDLPELCEVDLSTSDPALRAARLHRLDACVETGMPTWLKLRTDAGPCRVAGGTARLGDGFAVHLDAHALCPPLAGKTLTVDWGLFQGTSLEHTSVAELRVAGRDDVDRALLSRRHTKLRLSLPQPRRALLAGALACALGLGFVAIAARRWWRRRQHGADRA